MFKRKPEPRVTSWSVTVKPPVQGDARWRARLLEQVRAELERRLAKSPESDAFTWSNTLLQVEVRRRSGTWQPGAEIQLAYQGGAPASGPAGQNAPALTTVALPDDRLARVAERLVGLDAIQDELLLRLHCRWNGRLEVWQERTGSPLSPAVRAQLADRVPLFLFAGDPGVGKSALAQVLADRYCREAETGGRLILLGTDVRGNGLVGDFGNRLRAAFASVARPDAVGTDEPTFLVIDEADAVAMRRSEAHAHQEDRAGTATLLQVLDTLDPACRVAVILTTNLLETVDAAVRRRGTAYEFGRPDGKTRRALIERWLPGLDRRALGRVATATQGMTPADIERALTQATLAAIRAETTLTPTLLLGHLRSAERTGSV